MGWFYAKKSASARHTKHKSFNSCKSFRTEKTKTKGVLQHFCLPCPRRVSDVIVRPRPPKNMSIAFSPTNHAFQPPPTRQTKMKKEMGTQAVSRRCVIKQGKRALRAGTRDGSCEKRHPRLLARKQMKGRGGGR